MFGGFKRYRAVRNAFNAKITYEALDSDAKHSVDVAAKALYASGGRSTDSDSANAHMLSGADESFARFTEFERFTLYSMAMEQLFIQPKLAGETWDPPRNPFALRLKPREIAMATEEFKRNYGLSVTLDT